jgi:two-component system, chemotaxis family, chemotaxis protein CheY
VLAAQVMTAHHLVVSRPHEQVRVLIVEDAPDLREFYGILLREEGFEVAAAANGAEALERMPWDPDVILLDLMMPVMDGYEFYERLRAMPGDKPAVIVLSAVTPRRSDLPGVHAIVPKPFDLTQLVHRVEAASAHIAN